MPLASASLNRMAQTLPVCAMLLCAPLAALAQAAKPESCPPVRDIHKFVQAWNDAVLGPGNRSHTCSLRMMTADARITGVILNKDGTSTRTVESPEEFVGWYQKHPDQTFWERTLHSSVEVYDNVARVTRTYEVRASATAPIQSTGIEDFQLIFDKGEWKVFSLLWQDASPGHPLPGRYLPPANILEEFQGAHRSGSVKSRYEPIPHPHGFHRGATAFRRLSVPGQSQTTQAEPAPAAPAAATPPAKAPTVCLSTSTLEELVKALDDAVSGPADKDRTCLKALLIPGATLSPITRTVSGAAGPHVMTVDGWIDAVKKRGNTVFYERQVKFTAETYGHMAHLWSTYELRATPDGKAQVRGINSIQAVQDGTRWRVFDILWLAGIQRRTYPRQISALSTEHYPVEDDSP